eukprot:2359227-Pleurochrysis_carterae.AAC.2
MMSMMRYSPGLSDQSQGSLRKVRIRRRRRHASEPFKAKLKLLRFTSCIILLKSQLRAPLKVRERCVSLAWKARKLTRASLLDKVGVALQRCYRAGDLRRGRGWERESEGARSRKENAISRIAFSQSQGSF